MKTNMRVLICEDEPLARETLRDWLASHSDMELIGEACDGQQALTMIRDLAPDLVFMDIQMPELTGLEVVRQLTHLPRLIFTTAYDQHAVTAFELNALDYLLKPFSRERFDAAVARALSVPAASVETTEQALQKAPALIAGPLDRILVRDRGRIFPLAIDEIEYLKADSKYTLIAGRGSHYLVRVPITELEARLDPRRFIRVHRSAVINLDHVESMRPDEQSQLEIHMRDGTVLIANRDASRMLRDWSI
jgi:two-component system LytT family response regulator